MGGVGTGVQPKDNPNPADPSASAASVTASNSMPPAQPTPAPAAAAQSPAAAPSAPPPAPAASPAPPPVPDDATHEDAEVDSLIHELASGSQPSEVKKAVDKQDSDVDALISQLKGDGEVDKNAPPVSGRQPGESAWDFAMRSMPEQLKFVGAQMRAHLGRDPLEQRQAFESMYGPDNVKRVGASLYFRPDPNQSFRKVDGTLYNGMVDTVLFNALNAVPGIANIATQAFTAAESGGLAAGAGSGAAGGTVDALTRQGLISGLNAVSDQPQNDPNLSFWKGQVLKEAGLNALANPITRGITKIPGVKQAVDKISSLVMPAADKALAAGGEQIERLAAVRTAFREFKDAVFPSLVSQTTQSGAKETGIAVGDAIDKVGETLGKAVGAIKQEALGLADSKGEKAPMANTISAVQDILKKNGYEIDDSGLAKLAATPDKFGGVNPVTTTPGELVKPEVRASLDQLGTYLNRLQRENGINGGTELRQVFADLDNLTRLSKFDKTSPVNTDILQMYKQVRNAASQDRNELLSKLYDGSGSPNEQTWKSAYDRYSSNIDAIGDFKAHFYNPQSRELLVSSITKSPTAEKLELLDGMKQVLGDGSKEWNALRGEMLDQVLNDRTQEGVLNAPEVFRFLNAPKNAPLIDRVLAPQEKSVINRMLVEASKVSTSGVMVQSQQRVIEDGAEKMIELAADPKSAVKRLFTVFNSNQKAIDYLTDEGFLDMAQKANGPVQRDRILAAMRYMNAAKDKMQIVTVPTAGETGRKVLVKRYAPFVGKAFDSAIENVTSPYRPGAAPNPAPAPQPAPQPTAGQ